MTMTLDNSADTSSDVDVPASSDVDVPSVDAPLPSPIDTLEVRDARIAARRAYLVETLALIPRDEDLPASATQGDLHNNQQRRRELERQLTALDTAAAACHEFGSTEADTAWLAQLNSWRAVLCSELMEIKSPVRDPRLKARGVNITLSIKAIDRGLGIFERSDYSLVTSRLGQLMIASGYHIVNADPAQNYLG